MVATCCRVDEMRSIRVRDVQVKAHTDTLVYDRRGQQLPGEYLEIHIHHGKRGERKTVTRTTDNGVETFRKLVTRNKLKADDLLFPEKTNRDGFRELLLLLDVVRRRDASATRKRFAARASCSGCWSVPKQI
jgi:hypothetical protein